MKPFTKIILGAMGTVAVVAAGTAAFIAIRATQAAADVAREYETMPSANGRDRG